MDTLPMPFRINPGLMFWTLIVFGILAFLLWKLLYPTILKATIDRGRYPTGERITPKQMRELRIERNDFHGDWNYTIHPRPVAA